MKRLLRIAAFLAVVSIGGLCVGCDRNTYKSEIDAYEKNCEEHGGLAVISNLNGYGTCADGEIVPSYVKKDV